MSFASATPLIRRGGGLSAFALWHAAPLAAGRPKDELRVLKLVARTPEDFDRALDAVQRAAEDERDAG